MRTATFSFAFTLIVNMLCQGAVIRVPQEQSTIQAGIDAAADNDTVLVASGTYTGPGNRDITFAGKAISLVSENGPLNTIIDCEQAGRGALFMTGESLNSQIRGFTITRGSAMGDAGNKAGGNVYCSGSSPTIFECVLTSGLAIEGAGIYSENGSPLIDSCIIETNLNSSVGAGISVRGGAPWIVRSIIRGNSVTSNGDSVFGGGAFCLDSNVTLTDCIINANTATDGMGSHSFGAGMYIQSAGYYRATLTNCLVESNSALHVMSGNGGYGGGIYCGAGSVSLNSCTFASNSAATNGGSIFAEGSSDVQLIHCISWDNDPEGIYGVTSVRYSDVEGGYAGTGNINTDPLFTAGSDGAYYLSHISSGQFADSPCINAGSEPAASICYSIPSREICMDELTTRTDDVTDSGTVDLGYHYGSYLPDPTVTPGPTPTPTPEPWTGVDLVLSGTMFEAGDRFLLDAFFSVPEGPDSVDLYVGLDILGMYFYFWPSWTQDLESITINVPGEQPGHVVILDFIWPSGDFGEMNGLQFVGLLTESYTFNMIGAYDTVTFGYR